jgi:TatD family-associated radical SAM protein
MQKSQQRTTYWLENILYLNITNTCSNQCFFFLKNFKQGVGGFNLKLTSEPSAQEVIAELQQVLHLRRWVEIVFCGFGEPTERLDVLLEVAKWLKTHYTGVVAIRVDTNGHGCWINRGRDVIGELKSACISKLSVSLNAGDQETYNEICRPTYPEAYQTVLDFVLAAKDVLEVEVSVVRMPEVDIQKAAAKAKQLGVPLKVRDYIPCFF